MSNVRTTPTMADVFVAAFAKWEELPPGEEPSFAEYVRKRDLLGDGKNEFCGYSHYDLRACIDAPALRYDLIDFEDGSFAIRRCDPMAKLGATWLIARPEDRHPTEAQ